MNNYVLLELSYKAHNKKPAVAGGGLVFNFIK